MPKLNQRYWIVTLCNALQPYYVPSDPLLRFTPELDHELGRWRMADANDHPRNDLLPYWCGMPAITRIWRASTKIASSSSRRQMCA